jgi:hypothetical protein
MNKAIEQMEFRIFHNIFCSTFKIKKGAFAFDEYVAKVFQRSVLELIEIRLIDWFYVSVLLLINLLRVKLNVHLHSCHVQDQDCDDKRTVRLFTLFGKHSAGYHPFQTTRGWRQTKLTLLHVCAPSLLRYAHIPCNLSADGAVAPPGVRDHEQERPAVARGVRSVHQGKQRSC